MKKIIAVVAVALLVGSMVLVFSGCGEKDNNTTTTLTTTNPLTTEDTTGNAGMVTDQSEKGENGALGDIVTDISEGISDMVTDASEDVSRIVD